jgi:Ca2+-binding RTX toxin-like protein
MPRSTRDADVSQNLRKEIHRTGYYPEVVADGVFSAAGGEEVVSYFVHHETTASERVAYVVLGAGADTYLGSDASKDYVTTGSDSASGTTDADKDVVDTRGGDDVVTSGSVAPGTPNPDVISTGEGDDAVSWAGEQAGGQVDLGSGENSLRLRSGWAGADIDIDARSGLVTADTRPVLRWTGDVVAYTLQYAHLRTTFTGTDLDEYVTFWPSQSDQDGPPSAVGDPGLRLDADMGAGDDRLQLLDTAGGDWVGGPGRDKLGMSRCQVADVRLGRGYQCTDETRARTPYSGAMDAWEKITVPGWHLRVTGTPRADDIRTFGARNRIDGRGGDDLIAIPTVAGVGRKALVGIVNGGAGDDVIRGSYLRDRLLGGSGNDRIHGKRSVDVIRGGAGRDRAVGGPGRDRCSAEVRRSCER